MNTELAEDWNAIWTKMLEDKNDRQLAQYATFPVLRRHHLDLLRERNVRRILLPGNGCSLLPHALVHLGYEVIVVDISSVANESVRHEPVTPILVARFMPVYRKEPDKYVGFVHVPDVRASLQRVARDAVPGGSLKLITTDLMEWEPDTPFEAIYDDRMMMICPRSDWPAVAERYARWLTAEGICFVHTINLGGHIGQDVSATRNPFEAAFMAAGFQEYEFKRTEPAPQKSFFGIKFKKPDPQTQSLPNSGKRVFFMHSSG